MLVPFLDSTGAPTDPTTPDTELSGDAGAFADCAEEVTTITGSNGMGYITLTGAETNYSMVALAFKVASGPKATLATFYPRNLPILGSGTLSAGSAGGGTLGTILHNALQGCFIRTTGGTGGGGTGGANNQARRIATYNNSTGAFTVIPNWETTPSTDTTYDILLPESAIIVGGVSPSLAVIPVLAGAVSHREVIFIQDATSPVGAGLTGLVFNSAGLTWYYKKDSAAASAVTIATMTVGTWGDSGFKEIDATHLPGFYEIGVPNDALAGVIATDMQLFGAVNMVPVCIKYIFDIVVNLDKWAGVVQSSHPGS